MCAQITAQPVIESLNSKALNTKRSFKIKLPKNYDAESPLKHPLIIVLDGDYLFNPVVGQTEFQTYFDDMPSSIIVGVMHEDSRFSDTYHDEVTGLPMDLGAKIYEFIGNELIPHIDDQYNTSHFRVVVGHDLTANLMNSFMLKEEPLFHAYVNISPEFVGDMGQNVVDRMTWLKKDVVYYMATASDDVKSLRSDILMTDNSIKEIDNKHLSYYFDDFEEASHYSLVSRGIARAF
jgi:predicted alpha/beta superfamily hydrolase